MWIICAGMYRSASTLQYQIVSEILEQAGLGVRVGWESEDDFNDIYEFNKSDPRIKIIKSHVCSELMQSMIGSDDVTVFYSHRDVKDVVVSLMEKQDKTFQGILDSGLIDKGVSEYEIWKHAKKLYCSSYENLLLNLKDEISLIARYLGIELNGSEVSGIEKLLNIEKQKDTILRYCEKGDYIEKGNNCFNKETLLHLNHISDGDIGKYINKLDDKQINLLDEKYEKWQCEFGYLSITPDTLKKIYRFYSQHGEDCLLWEFFRHKPQGFYLDVGAFDGIHLSNSYSFEQKGWKGICVEPHPKFYELCKENRPGSVCVNAACVSDKSVDCVEFNMDKLGLLSSVVDTDEYHEDVESRYKNRKLEFSQMEKVSVSAKTLDSILIEHFNEGQDIDFVSIDVEGYEQHVLDGFDVNKYSPRVVIIEANTNETKEYLIEKFKVEFGYHFCRFLSENIVFVRDYEDVRRMNNIKIQCFIEKHLHPYGEKYSIPGIMQGYVIDEPTRDFIDQQDSMIKSLQVKEKQLLEKIAKKTEVNRILDEEIKRLSKNWMNRLINRLINR